VPDAIYTSTNWGGSWTSNTFTNANWHSIAVSPDGTTLAATTLHPQYGTVYISTNSGATWASNALLLAGWQMLFSGDGTRLFAIGDDLFVTTNVGSSWTQFPNIGNSVACSADGSQLIALGDASEVVDRSTNGGSSWFPSFYYGDEGFSSLTSSGDGTRLSACKEGIYVSTNSGTTWAQSGPFQAPWSTVCSMDAKRLIASGGFLGLVCSSTDFGHSWTTNATLTGNARLLTCSQDGVRLAGLIDRQIYTAFWPPMLYVQSSASNFVLSWSAPATGWSLQQSSNITSTNWSNVLTPPTVTNFDNQVILAAPGNSTFFRLAYSPP
jgi:hypothetical protein